jgi:hypothetical protein
MSSSLTSKKNYLSMDSRTGTAGAWAPVGLFRISCSALRAARRRLGNCALGGGGWEWAAGRLRGARGGRWR